MIMTSKDITSKRIALGISQSELARRCKVTPQTISNIECGRVTPTQLTLSKIKRVLK